MPELNKFDTKMARSVSPLHSGDDPVLIEPRWRLQSDSYAAEARNKERKGFEGYDESKIQAGTT